MNFSFKIHKITKKSNNRSVALRQMRREETEFLVKKVNFERKHGSWIP